MEWTIPGTVLRADIQDAAAVPTQFSSMFLGGGMVLSQVSGITGLEPYTVQNWVKRGFLAPPVRKRYTLRQLCRIININMLKSVLPMEQICGLLTYINGQLDDERDDMIDDSALYFMFVRLAAHSAEQLDPETCEDAIAQVLSDYREPVPGAKARVAQVLQIMLTAWASARLRQRTGELLAQLQSASAVPTA